MKGKYCFMKFTNFSIIYTYTRQQCRLDVLLWTRDRKSLKATNISTDFITAVYTDTS